MEIQVILMDAGNVMSVEEIILRVEKICRENGVEHLSLFGSHATGNALARSDVDFIVYGCRDMDKLTEEVDNIETLRKIDLFFYEEIRNPYLKEDIKLYGKPIY